jgi:hypothetical protein
VVIRTEKFRIQLNDWELRTLRNLLAERYNQDKRNIRWDKKRIKVGQSDDRIFPIAEQEKFLRMKAKLLRKLCRHLKDEKWFLS